MTVESAVLSGHHVKTNADVYERSSPIPEYTDPPDKTAQCDEDTADKEHSLNKIRCLAGSWSQWRSSRMVLVIWSNFLLPLTSRAAAFKERSQVK